MNRRPNIAVLMAVHNRRCLTVRALQSLLSDQAEFCLHPVILDDASTDGTTEAILEIFPNATVIKGDGNRYWNGGMHAAWVEALKLSVDGYLWLNDDVELDRHALNTVSKVWFSLEANQNAFILVGATRSTSGGLTYGGLKLVKTPLSLKFALLPISPVLQTADTFNGNFVLINKNAFDKIGMLDPTFLHAMGDIDYGLRARKAQVPIIVLPGTIGLCERNVGLDLQDKSIRERWRLITSFRAIPPRSWWTLTSRHSGVWKIIHFLLPYRKIFFG